MKKKKMMMTTTMMTMIILYSKEKIHPWLVGHHPVWPLTLVARQRRKLTRDTGKHAKLPPLAEYVLYWIFVYFQTM